MGYHTGMPHTGIDASRLQVWPLASRESFLQIESIAMDPLARPPEVGSLGPQVDALVARIISARQRGASVMLTYGAHVIKNGAAPLLGWLVENGWVTHLATQGAGIIHDWEFAFAGVSSESVRDNAPAGRFGSWDETGGAINLAVLLGACEGRGFGESVGRVMVEQGFTLPEPDALAADIVANPLATFSPARADLLAMMHRHGLYAGRQEWRYPFAKFSATAAAYRAGVPLTVHPGIGYDIYANHPLFSGAAIGRTSETDLRIFAQSVRNLDGGVYLSVGSAIMSPQVFEKAFSAANNLRVQDGQEVLTDHAIAIVDIQDGGGWDWAQGEPPMDHPAYYLRFCKSFHRMGGVIDYLQGDNRVVLANLVSRLAKRA